jgi:hypothetical protein
VRGRCHDNSCGNWRIHTEAKKLLTEDERQALVSYLSGNPAAGTIMEGTGGIRKLRCARSGTGKSGGVRVIYFYYNERMPLYALTVYGKGEKENLSKAQRNGLAKLVEMLVVNWRSH